MAGHRDTLRALGAGWSEGLTELVVQLLDRRRPRAAIDIRQEGADGTWTIRRGGAPDPLGRLAGSGGALAIEPPALASALRDADLRITVPRTWVLSRALEPLPAASLPFAGAFVARQVERVTPWRAADTLFSFTARPLAQEAGRLAVEVAVVPRALAGPVAAPFLAVSARSLALKAEGGEAEVTLAGVSEAWRAVWRRRVGAALAGLALVFALAFAALSFHAASLETEVASLDEAIAARRQRLDALVARAGGAASAPGFADATRPKVLAAIDHLAAILPDQSYLTELDFENARLRVSGLSADAASLVPLIERAGGFSEVSFFAPTVRLPAGGGERFFVEMRVAAPLAGETP